MCNYPYDYNFLLNHTNHAPVVHFGLYIWWSTWNSVFCLQYAFRLIEQSKKVERSLYIIVSMFSPLVNLSSDLIVGFFRDLSQHNLDQPTCQVTISCKNSSKLESSWCDFFVPISPLAAGMNGSLCLCETFDQFLKQKYLFIHTRNKLLAYANCLCGVIISFFKTER